MQLMSMAAEEEEEEEGDNFIRNGEHADSPSFDDSDHERERKSDRSNYAQNRKSLQKRSGAHDKPGRSFRVA
jgi:hypothetical protein